MLKDNNDDVLKALGIHDDFIPFYQVWQELVCNKTMDTYQYRIFTTISILAELLEVIDKTIDETYIGDANLIDCRDEAISILKGDRVLDKHYTFEKNRLLSALGNLNKELVVKKRLKAQVSYILKLLEYKYFDYVFEELEAAISCRNIDDIEYFANIIASQAVTKGWSVKALSGRLRTFTQDTLTREEQWSNFRSSVLTNNKYPYVVLISIPMKQQIHEKRDSTLEKLRKMNLEAFTGAELIDQYEYLRDSLKIEKRYFKINTEAFDVYSAAHNALRIIGDKISFISFFNLVDSLNFAQSTIISFNEKNKYISRFPAIALYQTYDYLESSNRVFKNTNRIFTDERMMEIRDKLQGAFSYTNISRNSLFQEEKYMNLWIALESLSRTSLYPDIISNVKKTVPAAESLRYVYRTIRNYIEDLGRCSVVVRYKGSELDFSKYSKQESVKEMIRVFKDEVSYNDLINSTQVNSLLNHRTTKIHELITDERYAISKITNHHDKVRWQIQRLYRIRNEIAHTALRKPTSLLVYIEHLYDYLSKYIDEIVTCIVQKGYSSMEETMVSISDNYDCFYELSKDKNGYAELESLFESGVISLL